MEFAVLELDAVEADRLTLPQAAAGALLEARPEALAVIVEFALLDDEEGGTRIVREWNLLFDGDRRGMPAVDIIELELWAPCWAVERFPFDHLLLGLLGRENPGRRGVSLERLSRGALLLWPEALVFLDDKLMLTGPGIEGRIRPLVSEAARAQADFTARLWHRLARTLPKGSGRG